MSMNIKIFGIKTTCIIHFTRKKIVFVFGPYLLTSTVLSRSRVTKLSVHVLDFSFQLQWEQCCVKQLHFVVWPADWLLSSTAAHMLRWVWDPWCIASSVDICCFVVDLCAFLWWCQWLFCPFVIRLNDWLCSVQCANRFPAVRQIISIQRTPPVIWEFVPSRRWLYHYSEGLVSQRQQRSFFWYDTIQKCLNCVVKRMLIFRQLLFVSLFYSNFTQLRETLLTLVFVFLKV